MAAPTIVLVHGAFADASSFRGLYDRLLGEGVRILAPPNPLRGLSGGDGKYLESVIGEINGPVLLVGHSYGGSVITAAGIAENVPVALLPKIALGTYSQERINAAILDLEPVNETAGFQQNGILGGNFLRYFRVVFDFARGVVRLEPLEIVKPQNDLEARPGNQ